MIPPRMHGSPRRRRRSKLHETPNSGHGSIEHRSVSYSPAIRAAASYRVATPAGASKAIRIARHSAASHSSQAQITRPFCQAGLWAVQLTFSIKCLDSLSPCIVARRSQT
jgi:hypothetical protein